MATVGGYWMPDDGGYDRGDVMADRVQSSRHAGCKLGVRFGKGGTTGRVLRLSTPIWNIILPCCPARCVHASFMRPRIASRSTQTALPCTDARRTNGATGVELSREGMGGVVYATYEADFEA